MVEVKQRLSRFDLAHRASGELNSRHIARAARRGWVAVHYRDRRDVTQRRHAHLESHNQTVLSSLLI